MRAGGSVRAGGGFADVDTAALGVGRRLLTIGDRWLLAPDPAVSVDPRALGVVVRQLSQMPLVTLGVVIGLCWIDRDGPLYPGQPTTEGAVLDAMRRLGARAKESLYHVKGALGHELPEASLIVRRDGQIRLGPALATWLPAQVDNLRRSAHLLPRADPSGH